MFASMLPVSSQEYGCFSGNFGACLDQGYDQVECFRVDALADCGGVWEKHTIKRDGTRVKIY